MTVRELDRPLRFGDPEQIRVVKAMELGAVACRSCDTLMDPADFYDPDHPPELCYRCSGAGKPMKAMP